jgi:hypothetical protein
MAVTVPARYSYTIIDELGVEASNVYYALIDPTATVTQLNTFWNDLYTVLQAITDGSIIRGRVEILEVPSVIAEPVVGGRVEQTGLFNFSATGTPHKFGEAVPAISNTVITTAGIDLTNAAVIAWITFLETSLTVLEWTSNNRQELLTLLDAVLSFRKRRKQLTRSTYETA